MADVHDRKTRSFNMSQIKGKNTQPEILIRKFLFANGFRFKLHDIKLPGKPDLVLPKYRTVIFINGCFWHGHLDCKYFKIPQTRSKWWRAKILATMGRDNKTKSELENIGWTVFVIWECQLKKDLVEETFCNLLLELRKIRNGKFY